MAYCLGVVSSLGVMALHGVRWAGIAAKHARRETCPYGTSPAAWRLPMCKRNRWVYAIFHSVALLLGLTVPAVAESCRAVPPHPLSDAAKAYLQADYAQTETLYRSALASQPGDPGLTVGLVRALLREEKVSDADTALKSALTSVPKSAILLTAIAEIDYRKGLIVE